MLLEENGFNSFNKNLNFWWYVDIFLSKNKKNKLHYVAEILKARPPCCI